MGACVIGHITVKDADKWGEYRARVPETLTPWGGELLLRGTPHAVLNGSHPLADLVVLSFPDTASALGWHESAAYQALIPLREQAANVILVCYAT
jgi:uncharacterized protein (DUF1330 family)